MFHKKKKKHTLYLLTQVQPGHHIQNFSSNLVVTFFRHVRCKKLDNICSFPICSPSLKICQKDIALHPALQIFSIYIAVCTF